MVTIIIIIIIIIINIIIIKYITMEIERLLVLFLILSDIKKKNCQSPYKNHLAPLESIWTLLLLHPHSYKNVYL